MNVTSLTSWKSHDVVPNAALSTAPSSPSCVSAPRSGLLPPVPHCQLLVDSQIQSPDWQVCDMKQAPESPPCLQLTHATNTMPRLPFTKFCIKEPHKNTLHTYWKEPFQSLKRSIYLSAVHFQLPCLSKLRSIRSCCQYLSCRQIK
jgi:hypothetical protein